MVAGVMMTLIQDLQNKPRYPVCWGFLGGFFLGAPWLKHDRKRALLDMTTHAARKVDIENPTMAQTD